MRNFYYCNSIYQLCNILKFVSSEHLKNDRHFLVLQDSIPNIQQIHENLKRTKLFIRIFVLSNNAKFNVNKLTRFKELVNPAGYLFDVYGFECSRNYFDQIFIPKLNHFIGAVCALNKRARFIYFEEGLGSYLDGLSLKIGSMKFTLLYKLRNGNKLFSRNNYLVLNDTSLYCAGTANLLPFPKVKRNYYKAVRDTFEGIKTTDFMPITWLSQKCANSNRSTDDESLLGCFFKYRDIFAYRPHPRFKYFDFGDLKMDRIIEPLELKILNSDCIDNSILVSNCSTGSIVAKVLFNKEPYLIFTYKALGINNPIIDSFVEKLKNKYSNPDKILVPYNRNELKEFVEKVVEFEKY